MNLFNYHFFSIHGLRCAYYYEWRSVGLEPNSILFMCDSHSCTIYCWLIYVNYVCGKRLHTSYKHIFSAACKAKTILTVCGIVRCSFHRILLFVFKFTFQHVEIPVVMGRKKFNMQQFTLTHMQKRKPECFVKLNR